MNITLLSNEISRTKCHFEVEIVETSKQLREVLRLRHQVYCVERGFEAGTDGEETDEFDSRSRHVLLRHTRDGQVVGTVRLIAADPAQPHDSFPIQRLCERSLLLDIPLATTGEISRFALSKEKRAETGESRLTRLALMRGIAQLSSEMGLTHWVAVMERGLLRLQRRNAIHFDPIGPLVSYHGIRQPAVGVIIPVLNRIWSEEPPTWNFLTDGGRWYGRAERPAAAPGFGAESEGPRRDRATSFPVPSRLIGNNVFASSLASG